MTFFKTKKSHWAGTIFSAALLLLFPVVCAGSDSAVRFSEQAWNSIEPTYGQIVRHPFNVKLRDGSLGLDQFRFYEQQDAYYLERFAQVLRVLARRVSNPDHKKLFNRLADDCAQETTVDEAPDLVRVSPAALAYSNFLLALSAYGSTEETAAAVLPCYWIYWVLGREMRVGTQPGHPYFKWISLYSSARYGSDVTELIRVVNELAGGSDSKTREKMRVAFQVAARYELDFWDDAFNVRTVLGP